MIKSFENVDLMQLIDVFINTYNRPPWYNKWTSETAEQYLCEIIDNKKFAGFVIWEGRKMVGAALCHFQTWWNSNELYVDEFFIAPQFQWKGYGRTLIESVSTYAVENGLARVVLITDKRKPAYEFYQKNGFIGLENLVFMCKDVD